MSKQAVKLFKALSDETRVDIIRHLLDNGKELSCQELLDKFPLSQPTLSHHFNKLADANILKVRKVGASHFYSIDREYLKNLGIDIQKIVNSKKGDGSI
ncbi:helix-turn-helix transcriptional regulator [Candidatus Daviesbacteria bacterium]|nr:helix-turn-helix transcriptional regulator [Candidatus Daviesbacteria bacterium]